jgi:hypothetical protein
MKQWKRGERDYRLVIWLGGRALASYAQGSGLDLQQNGGWE